MHLELTGPVYFKIKKKCNSSCVIKMFKADKYPRHLKESRMKAYKPIIIQVDVNFLKCWLCDRAVTVSYLPFLTSLFKMEATQ